MMMKRGSGGYHGDHRVGDSEDDDVIVVAVVMMMKVMKRVGHHRSVGCRSLSP